MALGFVTEFLGISLQLRYYLAGLHVLLSLPPSPSTLEVLGSSPFTLEVLGSSPFTLEVLGSSPSALEVLKSSHSQLEVLGSSPWTRVSASFDGLTICNIVLWLFIAIPSASYTFVALSGNDLSAMESSPGLESCG